MKNVIITITYQGYPLTERFYSEHPEIHHLYPSKEEFMKRLYLPLLQKMKDSNTPQILEISENSIRINGVKHSIK